MNRFKKELKAKGFKFNNDYPWLPYYIKGSFGEPGNIVLDEVIVNAETATIKSVLNIDITQMKMLRNGNMVDVYDDDVVPKRKWKSVEVTKEIAEKLRRFLKVKGIRYEASGCYNLIHFQILVNERETEKINTWLERW